MRPEPYDAKMDRQAEMACDYDTSRGYYGQDGIGCFKGVATRKVHILYEKYGIDRGG